MNSHHDDRFDAALRARHQASLDRLSPRASASTVVRIIRFIAYSIATSWASGDASHA